MLGSMLQDSKYALRTLSRRPALTLAIAATLTLGIGANSLLFSIVDTVVLSPLPYDEPDRLVAVYNRYGTSKTASSPPDFTDRRDQSELFESLAATVQRPVNFSAPSAGGGEPRQVRACRVTSGFFNVLGVRPLLGQAVFPHEESGDAGRVAVLSHGLWQRSLGGDPDAVGRTIRLNGVAFTVLGVMPAGFDHPRGTDLWTPLLFTPSQLADTFRGNEYLATIGRLGEGVTLEQARAEMEAIAARVIERVPDRADFLASNGWSAHVVSLDEDLVGPVRPALLVLLAAVGVVLLIACANVANMLLASSASRERELSVRASLGASRARLVRQLLTESVLLALAGAGGGLAVAWLGVRSLPRWVPYDLPRLEEAALDLRVLGFTLLLALATGLVFGLAPAWRTSAASRPHLAVRQGSGGRTSRRLRHGLVTAEVAMALVLMVAAGLLLKSFHTLTALEPGFEPSQRLTLRLTLPRTSYPTPRDRLAFQTELLDRLRALPGVVAAAASDRIPLDGERWTGTFRPEGYEPPPGGETPGGDFSLVSPGFFDTMGIPLRQGRDFEAGDGAGAPPVVIVDEWTAKRFWPDGGAVGQRINLGDRSNPDPREVVGVVGHVHRDTLDEEGRMQIYHSLTRTPLQTVAFTVHARTDPAGLIGLVRHEVSELDAELPLYAVRSLGEIVDDSVALPRFNLLVLGGFALLALLLAAIGIYGVLSYTVTLRTAEIGVRMAFGAAAGRIVRMVVREGLAFVGAGLLLGTAGALAVTRLMSGLLFGVEPSDPATFLVIAALLAAVAFGAVCVPAWRASRLNPVEALRVE